VRRTDLGGTLSSIESAVKGLTAASCAKTLADAGVTSEVLSAAASLKRLAGQINVAIHATGVLLCLPHILEAGETVEYVSLGAGNTGKEFDLETNRRIAEFKFLTQRSGIHPAKPAVQGFLPAGGEHKPKAQIPIRARHPNSAAFP
jgi:hypothetical protein